MMQCPDCQTTLAESARFCHQCGRAIHPPAIGATRPLAQRAQDVTCPGCGGSSPAEARFCIQCGAMLPALMVVDVPPREPVVVFGIEEPELWTLSALAAAAVGVLVVFWFRLPPFFLVVPAALGQALFLIGRRRYYDAVRNAFWLIGLMLIWRIPRLLVPGLIALAALTWLFHRLFTATTRR